MPVIATAAAAPAMAASCALAPGGDGLGAGTAFVRGASTATTTNGSASIPIAGQTNINVLFSSVATGNYVFPPSAPLENLVADGSVFPGALALFQDKTSNDNPAGSGSTLTITFSRPVYNLVIPIDGFSWNTVGPIENQYRDYADISPAPTSFVNGSQVIGSGTVADPWTTNVADEPLNYAPAMTTTATWAGPISSITLHYYSPIGGGLQGLCLRSLAFQTKPVGCP